MIKVFLHHGLLLRELNNIHITLIRKKKSPKRANDDGPFNPYNVSYKFIWELLASR